jgi:hypothetical protein
MRFFLYIKRQCLDFHIRPLTAPDVPRVLERSLDAVPKPLPQMLPMLFHPRVLDGMLDPTALFWAGCSSAPPRATTAL